MTTHFTAHVYTAFRTNGGRIGEGNGIGRKVVVAVKRSDVKSFAGFNLEVPQGTNIADYDSVLIWCEAFGEFITAASYQ